MEGFQMRNPQRNNYESASRFERHKYKEFEILEEYEWFYLCGKFEKGELLYKECFSKFDVDGVLGQQLPRGNRSKYRQ